MQRYVGIVFTTVKKWSQKLVDGSYKKNWIMSTTLSSEPTLHDVMSLYFATYLNYGFHYLVRWSNKVKGYNKTKNWKPFQKAKSYELYIYRWIYSQHNYPRYMQLPKQISQLHLQMNMTNSNSYCFTQHILCSLMYWWTNCILNFKINLNDFTLKSHTHTQNIYTIKSSTNVTTINISNIT